MYTLRFPAHLEPKLTAFFVLHGIADRVSMDGEEVVVTLDDQDYVPFFLNLRTSRFGPKGGWPRSPDPAMEMRDEDRPETEAPVDRDFR
jgi:hypothetical protein